MKSFVLTSTQIAEKAQEHRLEQLKLQEDMRAKAKARDDEVEKRLKVAAKRQQVSSPSFFHFHGTFSLFNLQTSYPIPPKD